MTPPERTDWRAVAIAVTAGMIAAAHVGKAPPALPGLRAELGMGLVAAGWVVSIFSVTGMLTGMAAGTVADRLGHRRLAVAGLVLLALGSGLGAWAPSGAALLAARFAEGVGFVSVVVSAPSLIAVAARGQDLRLALGLWGTYMPAGAALMMVVSPPLIDAHGWRGLWIAVAVAAAAWAGVVAVARVPAGAAAAPAPLIRNVRLTVSRPGPWLLALAFALYTLQWTPVMAWLPSFLVAERGAGTAAAAGLTALAVAMNVPGNLAAGWLLHRGWPRWLLMAAASLTMGACGVGIFSDALPDPARYGLCLVFMAVGGLLPASVLTAAPVVAPTPGQVGTTNGLLIQGSNLGQVVGPPLVAAVVAAAGAWQAAVQVLVLGAVAGVGCAILVRRVESRAAADRRDAPPR